jgi:hypothetical protein
MELHPPRKRCVPSGMEFDSPAFFSSIKKHKPQGRKDDAMTFT